MGLRKTCEVTLWIKGQIGGWDGQIKVGLAGFIGDRSTAGFIGEMQFSKMGLSMMEELRQCDQEKKSQGR